jgi:23S rRNA pseudouridine1911/1915/1917 synthase
MNGFHVMVDEADSEAIRNEVPVERLLTGTHRILKFSVGRVHGKGWRLDKYLAALMPTISRAMIQRWLDRGAATIDGVVVSGRPQIRPGQRIVLTAPLPERAEDQGYPGPLEILYRDRWLLAANKPPGQLAHQAGKTMTGTLLNQAQDWFEAQGGDPQQVRLVNRIDRDTSGIVLLSLDVGAHTTVSQAMEARDLDKEYRAICHGSPADDHGDWRDPIGEGPPESIQRVVRPDGQECHTEYFVLERTDASGARSPESGVDSTVADQHQRRTMDPGPRTPDPGRFSLLRLLLHTGRQHQIRVHAAHNGCPLVGDWVYGQGCEELGGQALHAALMEFAHPVEKRSVRIEAPFPRLLADLWTRLNSGGSLTPRTLSEEQLSKLGRTPADDGVRRPSWLTAEEFEQLRREAGEL